MERVRVCEYYEYSLLSFKFRHSKVEFGQCAIKPPDNDPCNVYLEVKSKLEKELLQKHNIKLKECTDRDLPARPNVLVFCILSSRIETDIQNALEGVDKDDASIMMVILHYIIPSQVVGNLADEDALLEDDYHRQLREEKRIIHFAFHDRYGGLYDNPQNTIGMTDLVKVFTQIKEMKGTITPP